MSLRFHHHVTSAVALFTMASAGTPAGAQTTNWANTAGGSYFTTGNWDNGVPTTGYTANIAAAGTYTVTFGTGASSTINSLTLNDANATFSHTSGTLTLSTLNLTAGTYALSGGTISGATITSTGGTLVVGATTSTLSDVSIGAGSLNLTSSNSSLTIQNGTTFAAGSAYTLGGALTVGQSTEIDNLTLTLASGSIFHSPTNGITMTLGASTTVTTAATANITGVSGNSLANAGLIQETGSAFSLVLSGFGTITNTGTGAQGIVASGGGAILINPGGAFNNSGRVEAMANSTVTILATNWTNTGTFVVDSGATLNLEGTFTTAAIGTITRTGTNTVAIAGSLNNASATLALTSATGNYLLNGGTITGGSITSDGVGQLVVGPTTSILSGVSVGAGSLNMTSTNSSLTLQGGTTFAAGSAYTLGGALTVGQSTEIDNLTLTLASGSIFHSPTNGVTMTLGASTTVTTGATANITGVSGNSLANAGLIQETGSTFSLVLSGFGTITNTGTGSQGIVASGGGAIVINPGGAFNNAGRVEAMANSTVTILATNWTNTGTFAVDSGATLNLEGTFTTASIGTITRTGTNTVAIAGTLNSASATLALTAATGNYTLNGGTITGGSITSDGVGQLVISTATNNSLSGVIVGAGVLKMSTTNSMLNLVNGTTFAPGSAYTLGGLLTVDQSNEVDNLTLTLLAGAGIRGFSSAGLTLGSTTTVTSSANDAGAAGSGGPLTNAGLIQETGSNQTFFLTSPAAITNTGSGSLGIVASGGGTVQIQPTGTFTNSGRVEAMANSTVDIFGTNWTNTGAFVVDSGATLTLLGTYTTAGIGTITRNGTNTVNLNGTLNNAGATLALTAATGSYAFGGTISGGSITSDGVGQLVVGFSSTNLTGVAVGAGALNLNNTAGAVSLTIQGGTTFAPGSAYTVPGGSLSVNQSTEIDNLALTLGNTVTLEVVNNNTLTLGASTTVTAAATASISGSSGAGLANAGLIQETGAGQTLTITGLGTATNTGTFLASGGGTLSINNGTTFTNLSGTTLTGGTYHVIGPASSTSTLNFGSRDVQTLGAGTTVILEGANSVFDVNSGTAIDNRLTTLAAGSQLQILNGRNYTVANPTSSFTNNGTLLVGSNAGASTFTIGNGINFTNYTAGTQTLSGGAYTVQGNATLALGTRQIATLATGTTVQLTAIGATSASFPALSTLATNNGAFQLLGGQNFTTSGPLTNSGTLQLGGGTLTVNGALTSSGTLIGFGTIASNLQVNGGTFDPTGPITFTGNVDFNASTAVSAGGGSLNVTGTSTVHSGATVTVASGVAYGGAGSVTVNSGGMLTVQGTVSQPTMVNGTVNGNATFNSTLTILASGHLSPGNSPGTIIVGNGLTLDGDYDWDINGNDNTMAGGTFDQTTVGGAVTCSVNAQVNVKIGSGVSFAHPFWNQSETWPILIAAGGFTNNTIPQITAAPTAFLGVYPQATFSLAEQPNALNVIWSPGAVRQSTWIGGADGAWSNANNWTFGAAPVNGGNTQLVFGPAASGTLTNDIPGSLALNSLTFSPGSPAYSLGGNGLSFIANSTGALPQMVSSSANNVTINNPLALTNNLSIGGSGNVALDGVISGGGNLSYAGSGILTLGNNANSYSGGTSVMSGTIQAGADGVLGAANVTGASLGTLSFTGSFTTSRQFSMNGGTLSVAAGQFVVFNGSLVTSAVLDGAGTFATNAINSAQFFNVTTTPSVSVISNSANDQFVHFTNGGAFTLAAGVNSSGNFNTTNLNGFVNQGLGSATIGSGSQLNVANFQSYGMVSLLPATTGNFTELANLGTAPLGFNGGSQTFIGSALAPNANVVGVDLHGQNMQIDGGLFVNNGLVFSTVPGSTVYVNYGALYKGAGTTNVNIVTQNGGKVSFGNCPGVATFGSLVIGTGGLNNLEWEINDAGPSATYPRAPGVAGPTSMPTVSGWSLGQVSSLAPVLGPPSYGHLMWTATPSNRFDLELETLAGPSTPVGTTMDGLMADFDPTQAYSWPIIEYQGAYTGPTSDAQLTGDTLFDTSLFANAIPAGATFGLHLDQYPTGGGELDLIYMPSAVPEPGTMALSGMAAIGWVSFWRRRGRWELNVR